MTYKMEPIFTIALPQYRIAKLQIFEPVFDELGPVYPMDLDGYTHYISYDEGHNWESDGLPEDLAMHIGSIVDKLEL